MKTRHIALAGASAFVLSALCWAGWTATITETFDGTIDQASWRIGPEDEIVALGGNPGAFLRNADLLAAIPVAYNVTLPTEFNNFTGFYRVEGVSELGVDLKVFGASYGGDDRPLSLGLISGSCELVLSTEQAVPKLGAGWKSFRFNVPAWKQTMPQKWVAYGSCASLPRDAAWNLVMGGFISDVRLYVGDPAAPYPVQVWSLGIDNPSITKGKFDAGPT